MKKQILILFLALISAATFAQSDLPKKATEISPLLVGEKIPNFTLKSAEDVDVNLSDLFKIKKTILIFYRGGWCPYCNLHLSAIGEAEKELLELGYQIIAISPDAPKNLKITDEKAKLNYLLLSDANGALTKAIGIAFQVPENYKTIISNGSDGVNTSFLPVPSVFIIGVDGAIQFEHITPDYKNRITNELLLATAKVLK
ncbi:MAG: AhpC/TSA family protein [Flavobacterium sp.]|nr:AhpC/TSA family protein [Flavobacterium sp.]